LENTGLFIVNGEWYVKVYDTDLIICGGDLF